MTNDSQPIYNVPPRDNIRLIDAICQTYDRVDYQPVFQNGKLVKTFCNLAANDIAKAMGCNDLDAKTADEIAEYMLNNPNDWLELRCAGLNPDQQTVAFKSIQAWANMGYLVFAIMRAAELGGEHGHIAIIRPGLLKTSAKWGLVPVCMNIGKECFVGLGKAGPMKGVPVGINEAFVPIPHFYCWRGRYGPQLTIYK